jgi:hypothetical protein
MAGRSEKGDIKEESGGVGEEAKKKFLAFTWLGNMKINPFKMKLIYILFKNSVRTSKRTPNFTITKINWLMLFKEIINIKL